MNFILFIDDLILYTIHYGYLFNKVNSLATQIVPEIKGQQQNPALRQFWNVMKIQTFHFQMTIGKSIFQIFILSSMQRNSTLLF